MSFFDLSDTCELVLIENWSLEFLTARFLYTKCLRKASNFQQKKNSKYWSLKEARTSHDKKGVFTDNPEKSIW